MKISKKIISFVLAVSIILSSVMINYHNNLTEASEPGFETGDTFEFGVYPQDLVEDDDVLTELNKVNSGWKRMNVYYGNGTNTVYSASYMLCNEVTINGKKYRGIKFSDYIPCSSTKPKDAEYSYQDDNGYYKNNTYWFEYQPLTWRVLEPDAGIVISEKIIDSRAFQGLTYWGLKGALGVFYNDSRKTTYAHDYEKSQIRNWLNGTFYSTAFSSCPKSAVIETLLDNSSPLSSQIKVNATKDKIYLPSYTDAINNKYGFDVNKPSTMISSGTDYANCMGLENDSNGSPWWTRTTEGDSDGMMHVTSDGKLRDTTVMASSVGVRPMMTVDLQNAAISKGANIDANEDDWELLKNNLETFFMANSSYDCTSSGAFNQVINSILMCNYLTPENIYTHYFNDYKDIYGVSDPLDQLNNDYFDQYMVFPADNMDWLIRNVFNQSPTHSLSTDDRYYYDGNYYVGWYPSGSNYIDITIENAHTNPDGSYDIAIKVEESYMGDEEPGDVYTYGVSAAFRETDGIRHWSFYEIKNITQFDYHIGVYSTNTALATGVREEFELAFSLYQNGFPVDDWKQMAVVIGNPKVISVSDYKKSDDLEYITVTGLSEGTSTLTVTDSKSKAYVILNITVYNGWVGVNTYCQNNLPSFNVNHFASGSIQTNFLDVNGLSVNGYTCQEIGTTGRYKITFNVYNSDYHYGSVDVFDKNGKWKSSEPIEKRTEMSSLYDWGEKTFLLLSDTVTGQLFSYTSSSVSKKTKIEIEIPEGGYFRISNDISVSPGAFLYNVSDFMMTAFDIVCEFVDIKNMEDQIQELLLSDIDYYNVFMDEFTGIAYDSYKVATEGSAAAACEALAIDAESLLGSLRISLTGVLKTVTGVTEDIFMKSGGIFGLALKTCFMMGKATSIYLQANNLVGRIGGESITVFPSDLAENKTTEGVWVVDNNNRIEDGAVLQAFRVPKTNEAESLLKDKLDFDEFLLYNICFVKGEKSVQPSGKVEVRIRIPVGANRNTSSVLRQEKDGSWTVLEAYVDGNFIVFETDHLSLYSVVWNNVSDIVVVTLPHKLEYVYGEELDMDGLLIKVTHNDGYSETLSKGFICSPVVFEKPGKRDVSVRYGNIKTQFSVMVKIDAQIEILTPSVTKINYGDSIILHSALSETLPDGAVIKWKINNDHFDLKVSSDGLMCELIPKNNGESEVTVFIADEDGNIIGGTDTQTMISKAGFFDKIIAFFKKLFGLTKVIQQSLNTIY